jgi:hypothetical protein
MNSFSLYEYGFVLRLPKLDRKNFHIECVYPHFLLMWSNYIQVLSLEISKNSIVASYRRYLICLPFW